MSKREANRTRGNSGSMYSLDCLYCANWDKLAQKKAAPILADRGRFGNPLENYSFLSVSSKACTPAPPFTSTSALTLL